MKCRLCPRRCGADREEKMGFCGADGTVRVSKIMLHHWEEPCISGTDEKRGSGAVFFSGCSLGCVYCQNREISRRPDGEPFSPEKLGKKLLELQDMGAFNINLVTPTHYAHRIIEALRPIKKSLFIPVVWNTSGYEEKNVIKALAPYVDVFLTDFKYFSSELSKRYSGIDDYRERALSALSQMVEQTGRPLFDENGMLKRGIVVRQLVLPGARQDSSQILRLIKNTVGAENVILSLMAQYTPEFLEDGFPELNRRITTFEYNKVLKEAVGLGFTGYFQERESATSSYTPEFSR